MPGEKTRPVLAHVKSAETGWGLVWAYPADDKKIFRVPLYDMTVSGTNDAGESISQTFKVIRFGVQQKTEDSAPHVVGLKDMQTHILNRVDYDGGSWQLYDNFLIHDGADRPQKSAWGQIGCIEVTGRSADGTDNWVVFEALVLSLSGETDPLVVSRARKFKVKLDAVAKRPPLIPVK